MLSKAQNKYIRSLSQHKYRKEHSVFIAEGDKIAREWLQSSSGIDMIVALSLWVEDNSTLIDSHPEASLHIVDETEMKSLSGLHTASPVLLVIPQPKQEMQIPHSWSLALDDIQDPGNMGTIIRIADWFGIKNIYCSPGCVDVYNPKVIQAAMGGHLRVAVHTVDLSSFLSTVGLPVLAATLDGQNVSKISGIEKGIIVIGNESKGISEDVKRRATIQVTIPRMGGAESLNAGVSTGILCALLMIA